MLRSETRGESRACNVDSGDRAGVSGGRCAGYRREEDVKAAWKPEKISTGRDGCTEKAAMEARAVGRLAESADDAKRG